MGGCLSSSPDGGAAAIAVKGQAYATTNAHHSINKVNEQQQQQHDPSQKQEKQQQPGAATQSNHVTYGTASCAADGTSQNRSHQRATAESTPCTPVTHHEPPSAKSPDLIPHGSTTSVAAGSTSRTSGSELQQAALEARHFGSDSNVEEPAPASVSAQPASHAEKSAAAAAKKPRSLKSRLLAAANLEPSDREGEPSTSSASPTPPQATADAGAITSPFATPANRPPAGGSAATGTGLLSSHSSSRPASALLTPATSAPGMRAPSSKAIAPQTSGPASTLMSQVEMRLIKAEQLLEQQRNVRQGASESSLSTPEVNRPPTREDMMRQLDLAEKKLMGMKKKQGGSGYT